MFKVANSYCSEVILQPPQSQVAGSDTPAARHHIILGDKNKKIILVVG